MNIFIYVNVHNHHCTALLHVCHLFIFKEHMNLYIYLLNDHKTYIIDTTSSLKHPETKATLHGHATL